MTPLRWLLVFAPLATGDLAGGDPDALGVALRDRAGAFESGVLEARETTWDATPRQAEETIRAAQLLSHTPLSAERAEELALHFESGLLAALGPGRQRAWAYFGNPAGSKLLEIPLQPGEDPATPMRSADAGARWMGFQNGITAHFDEGAKTMMLSRGSSDAVFRFRPSGVDPTLGDFALFHALKTTDRGVMIVPAGAAQFRATLRSPEGSTRYFFRVENTAAWLVRREVYDPGNRMLEQEFYGTFGALTGDRTTAAPYNALRVQYSDANRIGIRLYTVTKWTVRDLPPEELQISVPKGTEIIRDGI